MKFKFTKKELNIIQQGLKNLLELGISEPQENYIRKVDNEMPEKKAEKIYFDENVKHWKKKVLKEKDPLYVLYHKLFGSPATREYE